jgi:hypothetical protein
MLTLMQTPAEQQLECSEGDSLSQSDTPTQTQDSDQIDSQPNENTPSTSPGCPVCKVTFCRPQERNRHVESYLPHSILCPFQGCVWTGRRQTDFKDHWKKSHPGIDQVSGKDKNKLYDPRVFVKMIVDGMPVEEVTRSALSKAQEGLRDQGKAHMGANVMGRNGKSRM